VRLKTTYDENNFEVGRLQGDLNVAIAICQDKLASEALDLVAHFYVKLVAELIAAADVAANMKHAAEQAIIKATHEEMYGAERLQFEGRLAANLTDYNKLKQKNNKLKEYCNHRL